MRWRGFSVILMAWLLVPPLPAVEILTPRGSTWKYFDQGSAPLDWKLASFDDQAWPEGPAPLGYGDNDESTVVELFIIIFPSFYVPVLCSRLIIDTEDGTIAGSCGLNEISRKYLMSNLGYWVRASKRKLL